MPAYGSAALAALGDPTRQAIVELLAAGPKAVGELAAELPVSRPAVSQHLRVLKEAGLVTDTAAGTRRLYRLDPTGADAVRAYLDRHWTRSPTGTSSTCDDSPRPPKGGRRTGPFGGRSSIE